MTMLGLSMSISVAVILAIIVERTCCRASELTDRSTRHWNRPRVSMIIVGILLRGYLKRSGRLHYLILYCRHRSRIEHLV